MTEKPRLHPESWRELRQLIELHGAEELIRAIRWADKERQRELMASASKLIGELFERKEKP